jgi:hypothetical protein
MEGDDRVPGIVLLVEKRPELRVLEPLGECGEALLEVLLDRFAFAGENDEDVEFFFLLIEPGEKGRFAFEQFFLLLEGEGFFLVPPDFRVREIAIQDFEPGFLGLEVKETPAALRTWRMRRGPGIRARSNGRSSGVRWGS